MGDVLSLTCLLTEESKKEVADKLASKRFYINMTGHMNFSASNDILNLTLANMTG